MIKIQRLSLDSSWHLDWDGTKCIIDPWLFGPEIDGSPWINKQYHITTPIQIDQLPEYRYIVVSQSYEDHCHTPTLEKLDCTTPILATKKAYKKILRKFSDRQVILISETDGIDAGALNFISFDPGKMLDPVYYGLLITNEKNEGIFYCPHGFYLNQSQLETLKKINIKVLITTFTLFELPKLLGGKVNPGLENVRVLKEQINPQYILNTHDEHKKMQGIVAKTAKVTYSDFASLKKEMTNFRHLSGFEVEILE
ncbi:MAG: MBL fold metallo-hydrolase [Cyclobacteriaceae bacterium]